MTAPDQPLTDALLAAYRPPDGVADELLRSDGSLRPVWAPLIALLARQGPEALARRFQRGNQYLHDAGVFYRQHTGDGTTERDWPLSHIPVVLSGREWTELADGITERAELLEAVMADLYGPGELVSDGLLPAELIARNPEFQRPIVGLRPPSGHFLQFLAFEIGRSPDGSWFVLGDRTQNPSGAGFALENRMATARVFGDLYPEANVERLARFFRQFRDRLNGLAEASDGRAAILTPGQETETYFEHAYIARYLGFPLLESEDLKVEGQRLVVRTIEGPEPVSMLWRRLDARFADPLELDEGSALGTPGMVDALRAGTVSMTNCLGSGLLETRAFLAFLPRIAERLLSRPLTLPNTATWWCGQATERAYVRTHAERMMIGPALSTRLPFDLDAATAMGGAEARAAVEARLNSEGPALVGQEAVTLSTTPAMIDGALVARPMVLRVFAARTDEGWTVMPGGYARIGRTEDPTALALRRGGSVADVWVVGEDGPVRPDTLGAAPGTPFLRRLPGVLPARAADNLFWLGRYSERAEVATRELRAYHLRLAEAGEASPRLLDILAGHLGTYGLQPTGAPQALFAMLEAGRGCAAKVRDRFSIDGWTALDDLAGTARSVLATAAQGDDAARALGLLLRKLAGFSGLVHENMFRQTGWRFLSLGRALERADRMAALLVLVTGENAPSGAFDLAVEVGDSVLTNRRRYAAESNRDTVVDLMVLDPGNPRSILFQLNEMRDHASALPAPRGSQISELSREILTLQTPVRVAHPNEITPETLAETRASLARISDTLTRQYLA